MDVVPNEVLLPILASVDGASLIRCKRVCKRWHALVETILQHGHADWRMICKSEIHHDVLCELLDDSCSKDESRPVQVDWFSVYKCWYSTRVISKLPYRICDLRPFNAHVTCLKTSGDVIVSGHTSGVVSVWNAQNGWPINFIETRANSIGDLTFFNLRGPATLWPGEFFYKHGHIICASNMPQLDVYSLADGSPSCANPFEMTDPVASVKIWNDRLAALSLFRCVLFVMQLTLTEDGIEFDLLLTLFLEDNFCSWIGLNSSCVFSVGRYWEAGKIGFSCGFTTVWRLASVDREEPLHISLALVKGNGMLVIATAELGLFISVDGGSHMTEIMAARHWNARVTALALRGSLLAIGLQSGWLCVYRVQDSLVDMKYGLPDWSQKLYGEAVIAVDVTCEPDKMQPTVVAATHRQVRLVTWRFSSL